MNYSRGTLRCALLDNPSYPIILGNDAFLKEDYGSRPGNAERSAPADPCIDKPYIDNNSVIVNRVDYGIVPDKFSLISDNVGYKDNCVIPDTLGNRGQTNFFKSPGCLETHTFSGGGQQNPSKMEKFQSVQGGGGKIGEGEQLDPPKPPPTPPIPMRAEGLGLSTLEYTNPAMKQNENLFDKTDTPCSIPINAVLTRTMSLRKKPDRPKFDVVLPADMSPEKFKELQKLDDSLARCWQLVEKDDRSVGCRDYFEIKNEFLYRVVKNSQDSEEQPIFQLVIPESLRQVVLRQSHESLLGAHSSNKKTLARILKIFWWPKIQTQTKKWTGSCDICQRTVNVGSVPRAPLLISKLAEFPFQHICIDIVGEIHPPSSEGHRYIFTIIDLATRTPEAFALKKIDTKTICQALEQLFFRVGAPDRLTSDNGPQFVSREFEDFLKVFHIQHIKASYFHPQANGVLEKYHYVLKKSITRLCAERPKDWHLYLQPALFAYRETPHSATGFSPNELLYGRTLKGPLQILKQLLIHDSVTPEVKTSYQYVLDLRSRIQETCDLARSELAKAQQSSKIYFDKKARHRSFKVGDSVLLMLPSHSNRLEARWQGPFPVTKIVGVYDYQIQTESGKLKTFHINMLKGYNIRPTPTTPAIPIGSNAVASVVAEELNSDELSIQDTELITHYNIVQKESYSNVEYDPSLSARQLKQASDLVKEFGDIFSDVPTITNLGDQKIVLSSETPIHCRPYPVPVHLKAALDKELDFMLAAKLIEPSSSFFCSPLVLIKKPDGDLRVCANYKELNKVSLVDPEPMLLAEDIFDKLGGNKVYSKFDLCKGYYQVPLQEASRDYSTFTCHRGLFRFCVTPFGISSAPANFTRLMRLLLRGTTNLDSYLDDILAHTNTWQEHLDTLRIFFQKVREANLRIKPSKSLIGCPEIHFLGHSIVEDGRKPSPENLKKILDSSRPQTKKQIMALLGLVGFYQGYIPHYSHVTAPLTDLLRKNQPTVVVWTDRQEKSFQTLKLALVKEPILKLPVLDRPFVLRVDASDCALGAMIMQEHAGTLHPVCFASKKLCDREKRYSISEREGLGVVWAIQKFKKYLYGAPFILQSDHKPLTVLRSSDSSSARLQRWSLALQPYSFRFEYLPGELNVGADYLSRM